MKQVARGARPCVAALMVFAGACADFSREGLAGATAPERAPGQSGGRGGSASGGRGTGGTGGGGASDPKGTGGSSAGPSIEGGADAATGPMPGAPDAAVLADGSGVQSVPPRMDAAEEAPAPVAPPAVDAAPVTSAKGACPAGEGALLLCLRFENAAADESEPRAAVTASGLGYEAGATGQAGRFAAGTTVRVNAAAGLGAGAFTMEAWVQPQQLPGAGGRAGILDRQSHFGLFVLAGGAIACTGGDAMAMAPAAVRVGQWSGITCSVGGGSLVLYVDGIRRAMATGANGAAPPGQPELAVGSNSPSGDNFVGLIDNVRLWSTVRTPGQVCQAAYGCD
jgi:hypothetical protein